MAPSDFGVGLWARDSVHAGQALGEYSGPRLPLQMHTRGEYVLQIPGTELIIDGVPRRTRTGGGRVASGEPAFGYTGLQHYRAGASENSPFLLPRCCALHANHSARPNARLELWPVLRPATHEPRQHMVLVASEPIAAGAEIRIDYEDGNSGDPRPTPRPRPNPNPRPTPRPTPRPNPIPIPIPSPSPSPIALALALALTLSIPKPKP